MIIEVTSLSIKAEQNQAFEIAIEDAARNFISTFPGCLGYSIRHDIGEPLHYVIEIRWKTLEGHLEHFRKSDAFTSWRASISPYFTQAPNTEHFETLING